MMVEFMLLIPILLVLAMGVWEFGRIMDVQFIALNAAREGARAAAREPVASQAQAVATTRIRSYLTNSLGKRLGTVAANGRCVGGDACFRTNDIAVAFASASGTPQTIPGPGSRIRVEVNVRMSVFSSLVPGLPNPFILIGDAFMRRP
jgi:Flp pilus assembly protein TadG